MAITLVTVPCLKDNYAYLLHDPASGRTVLVDAPESAAIAAELGRRGWRLTDILITHHHGDHIDGVATLRDGARVIGAAADAHRLPPLDLAVEPGDHVDFGGWQAEVLAAPGHTTGHVAYHVPAAEAVFTGDSLMALGCGRLFEGTAAQMWESLCRLRALPPQTLVCSGHEYAEGNARFALSVDPDNATLAHRAAAIARLRAEGRPTVPTLLSYEIATNPFLRADVPAFKAALGMAGAPDAEVLAHVRARKDRF